MLGALRARLAEIGYTAERLGDVLRAERLTSRPAELAVHLRRLEGRDPFAAIVELFVLGLDVETERARRAFQPVDLRELEQAELIEADEGSVRAAVKLVPHGDLLIASDADRVQGEDRYWVVGIHPPSVTLARLTIRRSGERVLDMGTGNGVQALLASKHAAGVVATDVNGRALRYVELNARLNGVSNVELREGSFFEPVAGERFDLIVTNPPYVISPDSVYAYRDSGLPGDEVSRSVVAAAPEYLAEEGFAHVLVSWAHEADGWRPPVLEWVRGSGYDAWVLHFDTDDPVSHAAAWLKPLALTDAPAFEAALGRWLDYLEREAITAIAYGAVVLRRRGGDGNWVRAENASLAKGEAGRHLQRLFANGDLLAADGLMDARLSLAAGNEVRQTLSLSAGAPTLERSTLTLREGIGFELGLDEHTLQLLLELDGVRTLGEALAERAAALGVDEAKYVEAALPVVRRLLELGFLGATR